jgi:acyl-CoA synthetase (NDP forming)
LPSRADLEAFFNPQSVAVLGRVDRSADAAGLLEPIRARYGCEQVYLVHPAGGEVDGVTIYPSVLDIPGPVTLAIVNIGPAAVPGAVDECGRKGIAYVLVFTAGFSEVGPEGASLERQLAETAGKYGVRIFGPNTNTNAFERMPEIANLRGGKIGLVTQSGHQGRPVVQGALFGVGFSRWVPTGNEVDLEAADFIEYFAGDPETAVIAGYFEGFKDPAKLRRALGAAADAGKPVVALKIGSTTAGQRMASSHTGHLTGSDAVIDGLFAQYAVTRVRDLDELLDTSALFAKLPAGTGTGTRVGLYSISGGSGTLMAEIAEAAGVEVPTLTAATQAAMRELLPDYLTVSNPVDNGGSFLLTAPIRNRFRLLTLLAEDPNIDVVVVGLTGAVGEMTDNLAADIRALADTLPVPIVATWNSYKTDEQGFRDLVASGIPLFRSFRGCFSALHAWGEYGRRAASFRHRKASAPTELSPEIHRILSRDGALSTDDSGQLLDAFAIPRPHDVVATTPEAAALAADGFGYPVVLKVVSPDIPHKSDLGLVHVGLTCAEDVCAAARELLQTAVRRAPEARIDGILVQQQAPAGIEMIVGVTRDPVLGAAVTVGTGGIFAEVLRDVATRPLPLDRDDAREMVTGLRGYALLDGARGRPKGDLEALLDVIESVARLAEAAGSRLSELDLNPVVVTPQGAVAVDSLVIITDLTA